MKRLLWLAIFSALLYTGAAQALNCTLTPANGTLNFGTYGGQFNDDINQTYTVKCTRQRRTDGTGQLTVNWIMNVYAGNSGNTTQEYMTDNTTGTFDLNYNFYQDPAHTIPLGCGTGCDGNVDETGTIIIPASNTNNSASENFIVYLEIPAGQTSLPADTYTDFPTTEITDTNFDFDNFYNPTVQAIIYANCRAGTAANVAFGTLDPSTASADASVTSSVTEFCTNHTPFGVVMDAGLHAATPGDPTTRRMMDAAGDFLPYHLYVDSGHTTEIGSTPNNTCAPIPPVTCSPAPAANYLVGYGKGTGTAVTIPFYAVVKLSDLQVAPAGTYSDTVTVTVYY